MKLVLFSLFLGTASLLTYRLVIYHDVENWPVTSATYLSQGGSINTTNFSSRYGQPGTSTIDSRYVRFSYVVDGQTYVSRNATPNRHPKIGFDPDQGKAYHHPKHHKIAVWQPIRYDATTLTVATGFLGILSGCLLYFSIRYRN